MGYDFKVACGAHVRNLDVLARVITPSASAESEKIRRAAPITLVEF
jgi:hypothetical protein